MYNEDLKQKFITAYTGSIANAETARWLFSAIEPFENEWGADLCTQNAETIQPVIDQVFGLRTRSKIALIAILREYVKWCMAARVPSSCDGIMYVDLLGLEKMRQQMVASPLHLQTFLDTVFDKEDEETIDNVYRSYFWIAFGGLGESDAFQVTSSCIDFENQRIQTENDYALIYREGIPALRNAATLDNFVYKHSKYSSSIRRGRIGGEIILRGIKGSAKPETVRTSVNKAIMSAVKEKPTTQRLSFSRVELSGLFYRMSERERAGVPVSFMEAAAEATAGKEYSLKNGLTLKQIQTNRAKEYLEDYQRWKLAFSI